MVNLGHHGWVIQFHTDSYCWVNKKKITIDLNYSGDIRQEILHEIAHIGTARFCNNKHNPQFWQLLKRLTYKYLKKELDSGQIYMKSFHGKGIYKLIYTDQKEAETLKQAVIKQIKL